MARFVIDAPTLVHIVTTETPVHPSHSIVAPNAIRSQALAMLLAAVNVGTMTEERARSLHERMTGLKMRLLGDRVSRWVAWTIARSHGWTDLTDAEYLAITQLQADALITIDERFAVAAAGIVPLAELADLTMPDR